jgi:hypothetical protein
MKYIVFSDLHLHDWPEFSKIDPETGLNTRFLDGLKALETILAEYESRDMVIFCGDFFHRGTHLKPEHIWEVIKVFRKAEIPKGNILAIPGQHDYSVGSGRYCALQPFDDYMMVLTHTGHYYHPVNDETYYLVPHRKPDEVQRLLNEYGGEGIVIGHFLAKELLAAQGMPELPNAVTLEGVKEPPVAFLGDFHKACVVGNWISVGIPIHHSFSDAGSGPGHYLLWKEGESPIWKWIPGLPHFMVVDDTVQPEYDMEKNFTRWHVKSEKRMKEIKKDLSDVNNVRFVIEKEESVQQETRLEVKTTTKPEDVMRSYCEYMGKKEMFEHGIKYIGENK